MKHIKAYEKYKHKPQDKIDDMNLMQEFSDKLETQFEYRLDIDYISNIETSVVGYGTNKYYSGQFINNSKYYKSKRAILYNIRISTDINPNGITSDKDIGRTYTLNFDTKSSRIPNFYEYSRDMNDVLQRFNYYVINTLNIDYLSKEELKQKQLNKIANKYNL
jgi:hypothetical protein